MKETYPLKWPQGQPRTAIRDREDRRAWKKPLRASLVALDVELKRFGALMESIQVTMQEPNDVRSAPDPSVAVWFSRSKKDDFAWQNALGITNPAPSLDEIGEAFKRLAAKHHPDKIAQNSGGDLEIYHALDRHRKNAVAYVKRLSGLSSEFAIGCDKFSETRWNVTAIAHAISHFRGLERDGTSHILEQAMEGFRPALQEAKDVIAASA
jgi:hypothetical protein